MRGISGICIIGAVLLSTVCRAPAQQSQLVQLMNSRVGTTSIDALPQFADGQLYACLLEFNSLVRDDKYQAVGFSKVYGSFGLMYSKGKMAVVLKVIVLDFDLKTGNTKPNAPANAYFVFGHTTSRDAFISKYKSDTPGGLFSLFKVETAFERMSDAISKEKISLAFNRRDGGADIAVPLDLRVAATDENGRKSMSPKMVQEYYECAEQLLKSAEATLGR